MLKEINLKNNVIIKFTITTPNDELSRIIEPNVCVSSKRFQAIKELSDNGIFVGIMMNPVLPLITDKEEDIKELVRLAYLNGAKFIHTYMVMTLRENQRDYFCLEYGVFIWCAFDFTMIPLGFLELHRQYHL